MCRATSRLSSHGGRYLVDSKVLGRRADVLLDKYHPIWLQSISAPLKERYGVICSISRAIKMGRLKMHSSGREKNLQGVSNGVSLEKRHALIFPLKPPLPPPSFPSLCQCLDNSAAPGQCKASLRSFKACTPDPELEKMPSMN